MAIDAKMTNIMWNSIKKEKPEIGQICLIFEQGYSIGGYYQSAYHVAKFIKHPIDHRRQAFADQIEAANGETEHLPLYNRATHWMPLPEPPKQLNKEKFMKDAGYPEL